MKTKSLKFFPKSQLDETELVIYLGSCYSYRDINIVPVNYILTVNNSIDSWLLLQGVGTSLDIHIHTLRGLKKIAQGSITYG